MFVTDHKCDKDLLDLEWGETRPRKIVVDLSARASMQTRSLVLLSIPALEAHHWNIKQIPINVESEICT